MTDIAIIGGGLAGLTAAIHLRQCGFEVTLFEKKSFPQHKVCGEYISAEVVAYFEQLGIPIQQIQPNRINRFQLYAPSGKYIESTLGLGGLGVRRYTLDFTLHNVAVELGCVVKENNPVERVTSDNNGFTVYSKKMDPLQAKVVIGSFGRRSIMDKVLDRKFVATPANYIGAKYYLKRPFPSDLVTLYNFHGGYCGAVEVENGLVDIALLVRQHEFKQYKNLDNFEQEVLFTNPAIQALFGEDTKVWERPMAIANVSFLPKEQIHRGILMIGDAAGMIPPLAGNGMAMGIHAAKLAAEQVQAFLSGKIVRSEMERSYQKQWNRAFRQRLYWGRWLHYFMGKPRISEFSVRALQNIPFILPPIIRQTHGQPFD